MAGLVGMDSIGTEAIDKVVVYEKTVSDIDAFKPVFLGCFYNNIIICFLPTINLVNVSEPFEDIILINISRYPVEIASWFERWQRHQYRFYCKGMKGIDNCLKVTWKSVYRRFRFMLTIRVCRDFVPMKVAIISAKFHKDDFVLVWRAAVKGPDNAVKGLAGGHAKTGMVVDHGIRQSRETVHAIILENGVA